MLRNNLMNNESKEAKDSNGKMPVEDDIRNQLGLIGHVFNRLGLRNLKIFKDSLKRYQVRCQNSLHQLHNSLARLKVALKTF